MPNPSTEEIVRAVEQAADLRAAGVSWENIAKTVNQPLEDVLAWPIKHCDIWDSRFTSTARRLAGEAEAEARAVLRHQLRDPETNVRRDAAKKLIDQGRRAAPANSSTPTSESQRLADQMEGLSHDELRNYVETQLERLAEGSACDRDGPCER